MLQGLTTVSFYADDVAAARDWYAEVLGIPAYFARPQEGPPAYVEFRVGAQQHELGIIDRRYAPPGRGDGPGGAIVYWHVDDVDAVLDQLVARGATVFEPKMERGPGFVTASVLDPFGNVLGVMYNEHFLAVAGSHS